MDKTRTIGPKWLVNELVLCFWAFKSCAKFQSNPMIIFLFSLKVIQMLLIEKRFCWANKIHCYKKQQNIFVDLTISFFNCDFRNFLEKIPQNGKRKLDFVVCAMIFFRKWIIRITFERNGQDRGQFSSFENIAKQNPNRSC